MALIMTAVYGRARGSEPADRLRRIWPFGRWKSDRDADVAPVPFAHRSDSEMDKRQGGPTMFQFHEATS
jgi:hypothetical protein